MIFVTILLFYSVSVTFQTGDVSMNLAVNGNQVTLTCVVKNRNSNLKIFLSCPRKKTCRENCESTCEFGSDPDCLYDKSIQCTDKHNFIEYIIKLDDPKNNGSWKCEHQGKSSNILNVDGPKQIKGSIDDSHKIESLNVVKNKSRSVEVSPVSLTPLKVDDRVRPTLAYSKLLTRSEFILSVIGLLAVSLIFNIFFCSRIIFIKCRLKKTAYNNGNYMSMQQNQTPFNRCISQTSDPERIYEDTASTQRQMSFMTKIKNSNGNYVGHSTLNPSSASSTLLPPNFLPLNPSLSFSTPLNEGGNQMMNTPTQIYYPIPIDSAQTSYADINLNPDNPYTNFVSVQSDGSQRREPYSQPLYLAFSPGPQFIPANGRYLQYGHQPLNMTTTESSNSSNPKSSPIHPQVKNGLVSRSNSEQDNYKLSREMMEEADNLLRTADNLLKSTQKEINLIQ